MVVPELELNKTSSVLGLDRLLSVCTASAAELNTERYLLTVRVVARCDEIAGLLAVNEAVRLQLSLAAWIHRLGEVYLEELPSLGKSPILDADAWLNYVSYVTYSTLPLIELGNQPLIDIVLNHRRSSRDGLGDRPPLASRILCLVTEYEEMVFNLTHDAQSEHAVQCRFLTNAERRYDDDIVQALFLSLQFSQGMH